MNRECRAKIITRLRDVRGISRAVVIMLVLVAVLLVAVSIPVYIHYRSVWREIECMTSLDTAKRQMIDEFLFQYGDLDKNAAKAHVGYVMNGWDDLCPGGGIVYITKDNDPDAEMPYKLVCGVHGEDAKERTRLNANYVFEYVCDRVEKEKAKGEEAPETVTLTLNGEELTVKLVDKDQNVKRGTDTSDYDDPVVAFFGVEGKGFENTGASGGDVCYFAYAQKEYCANWTVKRAWYGDSWILTEHAGEVLPG